LVECANYEVHYYYANFSIILLIHVSNIPASMPCSEIPTRYGFSLRQWTKFYTHSK